jgi:hypothetical protein
MRVYGQIGAIKCQLARKDEVLFLPIKLPGQIMMVRTWVGLLSNLLSSIMLNLVVMGHTHIPKLGLEGDRANYLNCGFECVPTPDMEKDKMTFGVVTTENGKAVPSVYYATANGEVGVLNPPPPKAELLGEIAMDYSCYITVENKSSEDYEIVPGTVNSEYGYFVVLPPEKIASNSTVKFWIQDFLGTEGRQGEVIYQGKKSGQKVPLTFRCTTVNVPGVNPNPNMCEGTNEFYTKSGSDNWGGKTKLRNRGVRFLSNLFFMK